MAKESLSIGSTTITGGMKMKSMFFVVAVLFSMLSVADAFAHCSEHQFFVAMVNEEIVHSEDASEEAQQVAVKDETKLLEDALNKERFEDAKEVYETYESLEAYGSMKSDEYALTRGTLGSMPHVVFQLKE